MKLRQLALLNLVFVLLFSTIAAYSLGETEQTVIYQITHHTNAGELTSYTTYSIVAQEKAGYWLQRTTHMQIDSKPLSITQTLLESSTHKPLRYIMHRPARMDRPAIVVDMPLEEMGKDEVLPTPITDAFADAGRLQVQAGEFAVWQGQVGEFSLWANPDVPVLGVVKVETPEWTMELFRIEPSVTDLFPHKPPKGGRVFLEE